MSRYGGGGRDRDRYSSGTRLYVGHLSSRTRTHDLEDLFSRYGRVRDVDMKRDYAFVDFSDPRDAEDARYSLNGRDVDGSRIIVEFSRGTPRGPGSSRDRDFGGRGPPPGSGRCFNCGIDGHWARDCKAGDWKNKCYRCGERGHVERNCQNSPKKLRGRSVSRSPSPRRRLASPRRGRSRSRSFSRSRSYSQSRSPPKKERVLERANRSRSPRPSRSPKRQRSSPMSSSRSPKRHRGSPVSSRGRKRSPSPEERDPRGRDSLSPRDDKHANGSDYGESPRAKSRSPIEEAEKESPRNGGSQSPYEENGRDRSPSPVARNGRVIDDDDDYQGSPRGSE
ncbi:uncharacterized protein LOC141600019 isoform X1 [Silene latifolia]|uniref:uncharacterized protein LOC141600019 isoform X1 n=2 Tax=Silene latifolia TaxID=37657 RepID=UPI003D77989C